VADEQVILEPGPDQAAVRTALWRAIHVHMDAPPVLVDVVGLQMTFMLPMELLDERDRQGMAMAQHGARASGTPFISFFTPDEMLQLASEAGFKDVRHVSGTTLNDRYFAGRGHGLRVSTGEDFLVANT
jgi:O-methyltransferase involved in polyketide biosynthesis